MTKEDDLVAGRVIERAAYVYSRPGRFYVVGLVACAQCASGFRGAIRAVAYEAMAASG
jgi:hypothetical protein